MKLFEMRKRPRKAGLANLQFGYKGCGNTPPFREGARIVLPDKPEMEFFPLMDGKQFLLRLMTGGGDFQCWFGGTDENPFLVQLKYGAFQFFQKGEDLFYHSLKPEVITEFEKVFKVSAKRQGDIFAVPIPHSWDDLQQASLICLGNDQKPERVKSRSIFGTRHHLEGLYAERILVFGDHYTLGEGVIEAPDHSPLKLGQVHILFQARNLHEPEKAD